MTLMILTAMLVVFLSGVACGVFIVLVVSIRRSEHTPFLAMGDQDVTIGVGRRMLTCVRDEGHPTCTPLYQCGGKSGWPEGDKPTSS
jgi:hypothetical protein